VAIARARGRPRPLAIVGNDGGDRDAIRARIAEHRLDDLVTLIERADDATVRALYAGCDMLAFPSRYEGFGIPILEAMAADRPMVLADTAVFRELTQGQGLYFPVDDAAAAADAIERVWSDPAERARQSAFGAARVRDFGFDHLAAQLAAIYQAMI
jgi:glycosyltransferase involved in cell wall biosynthesis